MRYLLLFFTLSAFAQTTPVAGIFHDGKGALRSLQGTEGAWTAPILVPHGVISAGYSGKTLWYKTETELHVLDGEETIVPAPHGPAAATFNETGDLVEIYFAAGEHAAWHRQALEFLDPVAEVPSFLEDLGPGRLLVRNEGGLYAWTPGLAPVLIPLAETPSFQLFHRTGDAEVPVGASFQMPAVAAGESSTARFRIRNPTSNPITISRLSIDPSPFRTFDQFIPPYLIPANGQGDFSVRFTPVEPGEFTTTLWINDLQVKLQGGTVASTSVEILEGSLWKLLTSPCDLGTVERKSTLNRRLRITPDAPPTLAGTGFTLSSSGSEWIINVSSDTARTLTGTLKVANRTFDLKAAFTEFPSPRPSFQPVSGKLTSGIQQAIVLQFAQPAKATVFGLLKLDFTPSTPALGNDAAIAFLPRMERTVNFRLNEGSTTADFSGSNSVLLQTGSTAGTIVLTADMGGLTEQAMYRIDPAPVVFTASKASISSSLAEVLLTGVDNTRSTGKIAFSFLRSDGQPASPGRMEVDVTSSFNNYFSTSGTGTFQLRASFPVTGDAAGLTGVDVEITNVQELPSQDAFLSSSYTGNVKPIALTIAGSDPSGGAGIQADLKTFHQFGVYGQAVITLLTVQNTQNVFDVQVLKPEFVVAQIQAILDDMPPKAAKTGALGTAEVVEAVADMAKRFPFPLVVDPVMISKHGAPLIAAEARSALLEKLLPLARLVMPNLHEAAALTGLTVETRDQMEAAARRLFDTCGCHVLVKGGHLAGVALDLLLLDGKALHEFPADRIETVHTHGTGCTYSAAVTAGLALGLPLPQAVRSAKEFITEAIRTNPGLGHGCGPVNHHARNHLYNE